MNQIIDEGKTFPWDEHFDVAKWHEVCKPTDRVLCATDGGGRLLGYVHVHPNGVGRTSHIANCGYCVDAAARGHGAGRALIGASIECAREEGYVGIQFNAVVSTNAVALHLYESFGFRKIGTVPNGFRLGDKRGARGAAAGTGITADSAHEHVAAADAVTLDSANDDTDVANDAHYVDMYIMYLAL
jgi:GNAT superfamily N-acetyltransferase